MAGRDVGGKQARDVAEQARDVAEQARDVAEQARDVAEQAGDVAEQAGEDGVNATRCYRGDMRMTPHTFGWRAPSRAALASA
jgi:hypothetical protein